jgi:hypothetical protein
LGALIILLVAVAATSVYQSNRNRAGDNPLRQRPMLAVARRLRDLADGHASLVGERDWAGA